MSETLTQAIFNSECPYDNPYQGKDKRVLFVCSAGLLRSATGARLYAPKYNTRACGTEQYALIPLSVNLCLWAHEIVFVNKENHRAFLNFLLRLDLPEDSFSEKVRVLDIPDQFRHMHPRLIELFKEQYESI
jgi:predicted protein tyrosine phosphatase